MSKPAKKKKVFNFCRHPCLFEKVNFWLLFENEAKVKASWITHPHEFAKQIHLFESILSQIDMRSRLAKMKPLWVRDGSESG